MALDLMIFDLDGTLVDTNPAHVEAWHRALISCGYQIPRDRIAIEIGKGGDLLVSALLGMDAEKKDGDKLRQASAEEFLRIARKSRFRVFPGALELLSALRDRGLQLALATSSKVKHLDGIFASAGIDLKGMFDVLITADDAATSKPAPDLVIASLKKASVGPAQAAMVGDTPYDAEAARQAGVACLALLSGGNADETLRRAGAREVWRDAADLLAHLDEALETASPGPAHLTDQVLNALMREALAEAHAYPRRNGFPVASVLAHSNGGLVARAVHVVERNRFHLDHAPLRAFRAVKEACPRDTRDLVLATTLEPCVMCTGAAVELQVEVLVYGLRVPTDRGTNRVAPPTRPGKRMPRIIGGILETEIRTLLRECRCPSEIHQDRRMTDIARDHSSV